MIKLETAFSPSAEDMQRIENGLRQHNDIYVPADGDSTFAVFLRNEDKTVLGGIFAKAGRGWLKIGKMWVDESVRGQGYGKQLIETAEAEGGRRGCHSAYLDTFSFQAPTFYEQCGYEMFGILEAFPDEHKRFFMRKSLNQVGNENE